MFVKRDVKLDAFALALLAAIVFTSLALISYDRADATVNDGQGILVYPASAVTQNICGRAGAWLADGLLRLLGVGAYFGLVSLFVVDVLLLLRREFNQRFLRMLGWGLSLVGITTLAAMVMPRLLPTTWYGPEIGPGGLLGAAGRGLVLMHFATTGAYVLIASVILAGLLLCTDYVLIKLGLLCVAVPYKVVTGTGRSRTERGDKTSRQHKKKTTNVVDDDEDDEEDDDEEVDEDQEPAVRILGRRMKSKRDEEDEEEEQDEYEADEADDEDEDYEEDEAEDEYEEEEDEDDDEEEECVEDTPRVIRTSHGGRGVRRRLAAALSIKKPPVDREREEMIASLEAASHVDETSNYELPDLNLLLEAEEMQYEQHEKEVRRKAKLLERTFASFGFNVRVVEIETGPVIAQYEVELESGLRLSKITGLADDLAIALRVPSVRIVAPIPGKNTVGIEVPNTERQLVRLREVIEEDAARARKMKIPVFLGKDVSGNPMTVDLATLP
ncbi:MAG: DNA translocase FtsK 4TM domain-containing protein, partial [Planctomycetota bacterium]|nr:DNA translocase FtsK 4TM domain-containing protein [Planctomycetota bacterium]